MKEEIRVSHITHDIKRHDRMWSPRSEKAVISPLTRRWKIQEPGQEHAWQKKLQGELHSLIRKGTVRTVFSWAWERWAHGKEWAEGERGLWVPSLTWSNSLESRARRAKGRDHLLHPQNICYKIRLMACVMSGGSCERNCWAVHDLS